ncbi:CRISPR-associated helicase Cas3' [Actinomadura gamaensis]|uniref:CRISPR-associated helicase Cas3 n=1 Tax=Actinomadura gamaensis TaxID=1763541 RepID=A0ABV9UAS6_9ACTN
MDELFAHSPNADSVWHPLADHLRGTAGRAAGFAEEFGAAEIARYLAMVHDVGKGSCLWQEGLKTASRTGGRVGIDHKRAGARLASEHGLADLAAVVLGHHGGLPNKEKFRAELRLSRGKGRAPVEEAIKRVSAIVPEILPAHPPRWPAWVEGATPLEVDMLVRLVFSCVVDADYLDTSEHFSIGEQSPVTRWTAAELIERFERGRRSYLSKRRGGPSPIDQVRQRVYDEAVTAAVGEQGIYRLSAPTGAAKTLASTAFALRHARAHGLQRVVMAVPFISITDQNAAVLREVLGHSDADPVVLEHHSGVDLDDESKGHDDTERKKKPKTGAPARWRQLASENWDAPFVVTTTVRLFESLFDRRPAAMRRVHRLTKSVIVLDEVQALPDRLLIPILSGLRTLTERFGATVLLTSATQPAFWQLSPFRGVPMREVITDPERLYADLRRVDYEYRSRATTAEMLADELAGKNQALAIVNTTAQAQELHRLVQERRPAGLGPVLHLSTRMVAVHRKKVLKEIIDLIKDQKPTLVVSTQLVEAGVDLDFPLVYRAKAPADSVQQAAGRCNRNGRLARGRVVIFDLEDDTGASRVYGAALAASDAYIGAGLAMPDDSAALAAYYKDRYSLENVEGLGEVIERSRRRLDFPDVAARFNMVEEFTTSVLVPYGPEEKQAEIMDAVAQIRRCPRAAGGLLRDLRPYMATLTKRTADQGLDRGLAEPVIGDLILWDADAYDADRGITLEDDEMYVF